MSETIKDLKDLMKDVVDKMNQCLVGTNVPPVNLEGTTPGSEFKMGSDLKPASGTEPCGARVMAFTNGKE